jgi:hypothetical protein
MFICLGEIRRSLLAKADKVKNNLNRQEVVINFLIADERPKKD